MNDPKFLNKIAEFTALAVSDIRQLKEQLRSKEAAAIEKTAAYDTAIEKAASSLYSSDFLTDESEKKNFIKKAKEDPIYLAKMIEKVCNAADVSLIGKPARVAASKQSEYDPVRARAFGLGSSSSVFDA